MATQLSEYLKRSIAICKKTGPTIIAIIIPIIFLPMAFISKRKEARAAYVCLVMMGNWMMEVLPLPITALMPVVFFPLFGIADTDKIARLYMKDTIMLFFGSLVLAVALEHTNLHRRIALRILLLIGKNLRLLMFGFMTISMSLSMWISNSAATAMLIPIAEVIVTEIQECRRRKSLALSERSDSGNLDSEASSEPVKPMTLEECNRLKVALYLSVAYSANIGGTATLTGTPTNIVFKGMFERFYPESSEITFGTWMLYNVPSAIICLVLAWIYLAFIVMKYNADAASDNEALTNKIKDQYEELGRISFREVAVFALFVILALLWFFRNPKFIKGWITLFNKEVNIHSATPAIAVTILFFVIPTHPTHLSNYQPLLDWKTLHYNLHWGILFLIGGGYCMGEGAKMSGLNHWVGEQLTFFKSFSTEVIIVIFCVIASFLTEVFSNTATANLIIPIVNELALVVKANPLYLLIPVTVSCSFAFMLPAGTPPNALAYEAAQMKLMEMVLPGLFMNFACCIIQIVYITTIGSYMFSLSTFPPWARKALNETQTSTYTSS